MLPIVLAQATESTSTAAAAGSADLKSAAGILGLTFLATSATKYFTGIKGKAVLGVAMGWSIAFTLLAIYVTKTLDAGLSEVLIPVLVGLLGASGLHAAGSTALNLKGLLLPLGLALTLGLAGCQSTMTPTQRYQFSSNGFAATVDQVATLIELRLINESHYTDIQTIVHAIDAEFDAWDEALRNDNPIDSRFVLARVERLLGRLVQYQLNAEQGAWHGGDGPGNDGDGVPAWDVGGAVRLADRGADPGRAGRGARADQGRTDRGPGPDQAAAQGVGAAAGRRDRLAADLRRLAGRHAGLIEHAEQLVSR